MASTYLTKTFSSGNQQLWTWSGWIKRSKLGTFQALFGNQLDGGTIGYIAIGSDDKLDLNNKVSTTGAEGNSTRVFRDTSAWYHLVIVFKGAEASQSNRFEIYVNGEQDTYVARGSLSAGNGYINSSMVHGVGALGNSNSKYDGSMAHVHFIDGTAYDASTFGETDATTGIWKPKTAPSVTYGTNGFFLKFENSGAMGTDSSGNANNFTVNGNLTQTVDTPSNVFCTWNAIAAPYSAPTLSEGNTKVTNNSANWQGAIGTFGVSQGKWYWEARFDTTTFTYNHGVIDESVNFSAINPMNATGYTGWYNTDGGEMKKDATDTTANYGVFSTNDIIGIALNMDDKQISIYKNGTLHVSNFSLSTTSNLVFPCTVYYSGGVCSYNFGNGYFGTTPVSSAENPDDGIGIFEYAVPTGYKALCTKSINAQEYD